MPPGLASYDVADSLLAHSEPFTDLPLRRPFQRLSSNIKHLFISELASGDGTPKPHRITPPPLRVHIGVVLCQGSNE